MGLRTCALTSAQPRTPAAIRSTSDSSRERAITEKLAMTIPNVQEHAGAEGAPSPYRWVILFIAWISEMSSLGRSKANIWYADGAVRNPVVIATMRSAIPKRFHRKTVLGRSCRPPAALIPIAAATSPTATSPAPAGNANSPGNRWAAKRSKNVTPSTRRTEL